MIKKNVIIYFFLIGLSIQYSCQQKEDLYIQYFPEKKEKGEFEYIIKNEDTILHGSFVIYDNENKIISSGNYINGEPKGEQIFYYPNGSIKSRYYKKNMNLNEESVFYHENGSLRKYVLYDDFGETVFIVRFDTKGNVLSYDGFPIIELYHLREKQYKKYELGDTLFYKFIVAEIPTVNKKFSIELEDFDNTKLKRKLNKTEPVSIDVQEMILKDGKNSIKAIVEYNFQDSLKTTIKDSIIFNFDAVKKGNAPN